MNNTFPVCKNCVYHEIPIAEEPCVDCQIHFAKDRSKPHFKSKSKPTNADKIRAMTDEELAEYLDGVCHDLWQMFVKDPQKMWLDWLKQEIDT